MTEPCQHCGTTHHPYRSCPKPAPPMPPPDARALPLAELVKEFTKLAEQARRVGNNILHQGGDDSAMDAEERAFRCAADLLSAALAAQPAVPDAELRQLKLGVIELHPKAALRERFYHVVNDLRAAGCIVDLWLMDIAAVLREHGYDMRVYAALPAEGRE